MKLFRREPIPHLAFSRKERTRFLRRLSIHNNLNNLYYLFIDNASDHALVASNVKLPSRTLQILQTWMGLKYCRWLWYRLLFINVLYMYTIIISVDLRTYDLIPKQLVDFCSPSKDVTLHFIIIQAKRLTSSRQTLPRQDIVRKTTLIACSVILLNSTTFLVIK